MIVFRAFVGNVMPPVEDITFGQTEVLSMPVADYTPGHNVLEVLSCDEPLTKDFCIAMEHRMVSRIWSKHVVTHEMLKRSLAVLFAACAH